VACFQRKVASLWKREAHGQLRTSTIYQIILAHDPQPLTRLQIAHLLRPRLQCTAHEWSQLNHAIHSRLRDMHQHGLLRHVGRVPSSRAPTRSSMAWRAILQPDIHRHQQARAHLYKAVAQLNAWYVKGPELLSGTTPNDTRESTMLRLRAAGMPLQLIADEYRVSRERVRQLINRARARSLPVTPVTAIHVPAETHPSLKREA